MQWQPTAQYNEPTIKETVASIKEARNKRYNIRIVAQADGRYTASWGETGQYVQTATSVASALRLLANQFETGGLFGSADEQLADLAVHPHADCKYCAAPIFFAHLPPPSTKWLAFDPAPIDAKFLDGVRVATFSKRTDARGRPTVQWLTRKPEGPVWVPHPETCGQKEEPPINPYLRQLWEPRRATNQKERNRMISRLTQITEEVQSLEG